MKEKVTPEIFNKHSFFRDDFPFAIRHVENSSVEYNLSKRFLRQFWKITLITEGNGYLVVGDEKYPFRKNNIIIIHPKELTTWDITGQKIMLYNIVFDNTLIPPELEFVNDPLHLQQIFSPELNSETVHQWQIMNASRKVCSLIHAMHKEFESNELNRIAMLRCYFHQLLLLLIRQSEHKYRRHPDWIANYVHQNIRKNFSSDISLRQMAMELHLSKERLCRLYKEHFGFTIQQEINSKRVNKVRELLLNTDLSTSEISRLAGFNDLSNFHRIFRSFTGTTPLRFRNRKNNSR